MFYFDALIRSAWGDNLHRCVTSVRETEDEVIIVDAHGDSRRMKGQLVHCLEKRVVVPPTVSQVVEQLRQMPLSNNLEIKCSDGTVTVADYRVSINQP